MSIYRIKMNGKTYEMEIELIEEGKPKQQPTHVTKQFVDNNPVNEGITNDESRIVISKNTVTSPMPGNVIDIEVKPGDTVKANEVVLILEAMKMENEICAPKAGTIKAIFVTKGQTVSSEAPLFEMED